VFLIEENESTVNSTSPITELRYDVKYENVVSRGKKDIQYLSLIIINNPKIQNGNTAKSVWASIEFVNKESGEVLDWIGRWEGVAPTALGIRDDKRMLDTVDIKPNNYPQKLRIAFKDKRDDYYFGFANANYEYGDWKDPSLKMKPGKYLAKVTLRGENVRFYYAEFEIECNNRKLFINYLEKVKVPPPNTGSIGQRLRHSRTARFARNGAIIEESRRSRRCR